MSAFKPYRPEHGDQVQSLLRMYSVFQLELPPTAPKEEKGSKFLIRNILGGEEKEKNKEKTESVEDEASKLEVLVSCLGKTEVGHRCIYCGKMYTRKYGLKIHIRTHTGYKPLRCKYCRRPFGDPSNLNKHVRLHASETSSPYRCLECGKVLVRKRDLDRHVLARHSLTQQANFIEEATSSSSEIPQEIEHCDDD